MQEFWEGLLPGWTIPGLLLVGFFCCQLYENEIVFSENSEVKVVFVVYHHIFGK
jgi:hypothetical protein